MKDRDEEEIRGCRDALAKKRVIPFKRGKKEGNKRRMAQTPDEKTYVEIPFVEQAKRMGLGYIEGDIDVPYLTERESFRDVLLTSRLWAALKRIDLDDEGKPWLDDERTSYVVSQLERISAPKLMEANKEAFELIIQGVEVGGDADAHQGRGGDKYVLRSLQ